MTRNQRCESREDRRWRSQINESPQRTTRDSRRTSCLRGGSACKQGKNTARVGAGNRRQGYVDELHDRCVSTREDSQPKWVTAFCNYEVQDPERSDVSDFSKSSNHAPTNAIISWRISQIPFGSRVISANPLLFQRCAASS